MTYRSCSCPWVGWHGTQRDRNEISLVLLLPTPKALAVLLWYQLHWILTQQSVVPSAPGVLSYMSLLRLLFEALSGTDSFYQAVSRVRIAIHALLSDWSEVLKSEICAESIDHMKVKRKVRGWDGR